MQKIAYFYFLANLRKCPKLDRKNNINLYEYLGIIIRWSALATNNYILIKSFVSFRMFIKYANENDKSLFASLIHRTIDERTRSSS